MEKISKLIKEFSERFIERNLEDGSCIFILRYAGISAPQLSMFRDILKNHKARFTVIKNSIAGRVFRSKGLDTLISMLEGPCGIVWCKEDPVVVAKAISNFAKENENLKIKGGLIKDMVISAEEVSRLATLPSKEVLYAQLVQILKMPVGLLVMTLKELPRRLVYVLNNIKDKK